MAINFLNIHIFGKSCIEVNLHEKRVNATRLGYYKLKPIYIRALSRAIIMNHSAFDTVQQEHMKGRIGTTDIDVLCYIYTQNIEELSTNTATKYFSEWSQCINLDENSYLGSLTCLQLLCHLP